MAIAEAALLMDEEARALWQAAVNGLPPRQRQIYKLRAEDGLSYAEIAEALGLSRNTVRNQLQTASTGILRFLRGRNAGESLIMLFFLY